MKLKMIMEAPVTRRGFMQHAGGLLSLLASKGLPRGMVELLTNEPGKKSFVHFSYADDYNSISAESSVEWVIYITKWLKASNLPVAINRTTKEIVVSVSADRLPNLLDSMSEKSEEPDGLTGWLQIGNSGATVELNMDAGDAAPVSPDELIQSVWAEFRNKHIDDIDKMVRLGKSLNLKSPIETTEIVGHSVPDFNNPSPYAHIQRRDIRSQPGSWDRYRKWFNQQKDMRQAAVGEWDRWMDDEEEYSLKRRERSERGEPEIQISHSHEGGMHQPFESKLMSALGLQI